MTMGEDYVYKCLDCDVLERGPDRWMPLFGAEAHVLTTGHRYGKFYKTKLDDNWNMRLQWSKYSYYTPVGPGPKSGFKFSKYEFDKVTLE